LRAKSAGASKAGNSLKRSSCDTMPTWQFEKLTNGCSVLMVLIEFSALKKQCEEDGIFQPLGC
jgi:hypothetical protein